MRGSFGPVFGERLRNDAAQRMPDDVGFLHAERIEQQLDVIRKVQPGVAALRLARLSMSADVDQDQPVALRHIRQHGYPVACVVGVAVDQHHRGTRALTPIDIGQRLAVRQRHQFFARVECVEIDFKARRRLCRGRSASGRAHGRGGKE